MRSAITVTVTFICCFLCIVTVLTIGSYNLQKDEIERALDFTLEQTLTQCLKEKITDGNTIANIAASTLHSQINSKQGQLALHVLYADENIIDLAVEFSYSQYNGTIKRITSRKTIIKDWENGNEFEYDIRFIGKTYVNKSPKDGGLKEDSVWKNNDTLTNIFNNQQNENGVWSSVQKTIKIKSTSP